MDDEHMRDVRNKALSIILLLSYVLPLKDRLQYVCVTA